MPRGNNEISEIDAVVGPRLAMHHQAATSRLILASDKDQSRTSPCVAAIADVESARLQGSNGPGK